jgi:hypothetical protein
MEGLGARVAVTPEPHAALYPPPLKTYTSLLADSNLHTASHEKENSSLRAILRDNLSEQSKIQSTLDLLRTELLARAQKVSALTAQVGELRIFRDVMLPDVEAAVVEKDREIQQLTERLKRKESQDQSRHSRRHSEILAIDQTDITVLRESERESKREIELDEINAKLEKSVSAVLTRVCRSVACGIVRTKDGQKFLCIFLKTVEFFDEPDDERPSMKLDLKRCKVSVNREILDLRFEDGVDEVLVVNNGKPEKLEKWLVALRGLRVNVEYN